MVRILKVTKLEERRDALIRGSGLCREILHIEVEGINTSTRRFKRTIRPFTNTWGIVAALAPVLVALFLKRKKKGFLSSLLSGFTFAQELLATIRKVRPDESKTSGTESAPEEAHS